MRRIVSIALIAGMFLCTAAQAAAYRWVDDQGAVHYTQTPPPPGNRDRGQRVRVYGGPTGGLEQGRKRSESINKQLESIRTQREEATKEQAQQQAEASRRETNCNAARGNLAKLEVRSNRRIRDAEGNVTVMTEEERNKRMDKARKVIAENCE